MSGSAEYRDHLTSGAVRGRGAGLNPGNRFESVRLHVLGEHLDEVVTENPDGTRVVTRVYADRAKTIINSVDSPDLSMRWTINPYRGCEHGCVYCYARPTHETLGWSCGLDFETRIVTKFDAAALLRAELGGKRWTPDSIMMSGVTDPYQPVESKLRITRGCLEVLAECRNPVTIITKNKLVLRDLDLIKQLAAHRAVSVALSITTLDKELSRKMEPRASSPADRLNAIRALSEAGVPVAVMAAPMIPALNEQELPAILKAASEAGARAAGYVMLRLPYQIKSLFLEWIAREFPDRASRIENALREVRAGELYDATPGVRLTGEGPRAQQLADTFKLFSRRYSLDRPISALSTDSFIRPTAIEKGQLPLF